ncbi:FkbM family methyltransferase (plasmid) [Roseobacteraceae bacterium NS-SX3]
MLWRALKEVENGFYVDAGAAWPEEHSVTRGFYGRGWSGINIDANPDYYAALCSQRPRDINLGIGVGAWPEDRTLYRVPETGLSTFDPAVADTHARSGWPVEKIALRLEPLSAVLAEHVPEGQDIHFLKIDVEGLEKEVIEGMDWRRWRPWIVLIEATEPLSSTQTHGQWEHLILEAGYEFVYFDGLNRFYVAREQAHLKTAFTCPPNPFDDFSRPEQRALRAAQAEIARLQRGIQRLGGTVPPQAAGTGGQRPKGLKAYLKRRRDSLRRSIRKRLPR